MKKILVVLLFSFPILLTAQNLDEYDRNKLSGLGTISVTIGGNFPVTGSFTTLINERVDQLVTRLFNSAKEKAFNNIGEPELLEMAEEEFEKYSFRNIILKRASGEELKIDLLKFRRTGNFSLNPYLKNDDVLIFPATDLERNFFTVSGAVMSPGTYHFFEGDRLTDAVEIADGLNPAYENVKYIEINRLSYDGTIMEKIKADINSSVELKPGDRVIVIADETERKIYNAYVLGEVNSPGSVPLTKNKTTLYEVINAAGGIRETASLKDAKLYTGNSAKYLIEKQYGYENKKIPTRIQEQIFERLVEVEEFLMYRMSNLTVEDTAYLFLENELRVLTEGTSVDFTKLNESNSETANYVVQDGDIIIIPQKKKTVYVFGQVPNPGHINYVEGENYLYYINKAEGLGEFAEEDDIMVIKGNSRKWISPLEQNVEIEAGDYIWIPRTIIRPFSFHVEMASRYLGIVGSLATIILLLVQFGK